MQEINVGVIHGDCLTAKQTAIVLTAFHAPHAPDVWDRLNPRLSANALVFSAAFSDRADLTPPHHQADQAISNPFCPMPNGAGLRNFLREYGLSTREGLALMVYWPRPWLIWGGVF